MRRLADELVLSLKDQIRTLRYSLRSEAEVPGSALPEAYRNVDLGPLGAVGAMIGTPVIRMADGLFTQVEHVTLGLLEGPPARLAFPRPISDYFGRSDEKITFTHDLYRELKALLRRHGARQALVSEHAIEDLRNEIAARHRELIGSVLARGPQQPTHGRDDSAVKLCAAISAGFTRARPIQKLDLMETSGTARHLMIAPNCYCGLVLGLSIAIATTRPGARELDSLELIESADAVVDARFDRFKVALDARDAITALAREFDAVLPFLP